MANTYTVKRWAGPKAGEVLETGLSLSAAAGFMEAFSIGNRKTCFYFLKRNQSYTASPLVCVPDQKKV